ncbi:hypothetical protein MKX08_006803 [Trichoderma sp. CBMAI-0020]|nr:hypothetical protein MKX08_006803 [Trichoderma sp. CBMAI-0020]
MAARDDWPKMPNGMHFDGRHLLALVREGKSPFHDQWDVNLLVQEIEKNLDIQVDDISYVSQGSNCYGFHIKLSKGKDIVARLARGDVNMPGFDGFPIDVQVPEVKFEAEVYKLLLPETDILVSRLLYYRIPKLYEGPKLERPEDISGRRLFVFQRSEGENNVWHTLKLNQQSCLLEKAAHIRASLYKYEVSSEFASTWLRELLFEQKPERFPIPVAPTREFCIVLFISKIEATIKNIGDMIGWESDHNTVGPIAAAAKGSLLRLIPHIMPKGDDEDVLYRFVIDHGNFGIHNMSIAMDMKQQPFITSVYDWETGCIVPAILSDPMMAVTVDLTTDEEANPAVTRLWDIMTADELQKAATWSKLYSEALFSNAPDFKRSIKAGRDARHLWFALRDWRGDDPEKYFGDLGAWAEERMRKLVSGCYGRAEAVSFVGWLIYSRRAPYDLYYGVVDRDLTFDTTQKPSEDVFHSLKFPILLLTLVIPLIGLVAWFVFTAPKVKLSGSFTGLVIGGRFSQSFAKGIDIIYSGLLAPALMTALNCVWFSSARLAIRASQGKPQEQQRRIPLATWVTASAYTEIIPFNVKYKLRTLNGMQIDSRTLTSDDNRMPQPEVQGPQASFKLNLQQQATISEQLTNLLNQMAISNSSNLDSEGGYIVVNATDSSLADLNPSVMALYDIPAFRLSAICEPVQLVPPSLFPVQMGEDAVQMLGTLPTSNNTAQMYAYWYPGVAEDIKSRYTSELAIILFSSNYQHAILGYMHINTWNYSVPTQYGEIEPAVLNITTIDSLVTTYSLHCSLLRQEGVINYKRSTGQTWELSGSQFQPSKSPQRSFIGDWQVVLNYHAMAEAGTIPGIAPAISGGLACVVDDGQLVMCPSINFSTFASNFVVASGRAQSILFNVAAMDSSRDRPEYFYNVTGAVTQQFYHITYVPALLLASLLSLTIAASTAVGMIVYARWIQGDGMNTLREVTPLRLVVDSGAGTLQDTASMTRLADLSDSQLQEVAKEVYIMY